MYPDVRIKPLATKVKLVTGGAVPFPVTRYNAFKVDTEIDRWKRKIYVLA